MCKKRDGIRCWVAIKDNINADLNHYNANMIFDLVGFGLAVSPFKWEAFRSKKVVGSKGVVCLVYRSRKLKNIFLDIRWYINNTLWMNLKSFLLAYCVLYNWRWGCWMWRVITIRCCHSLTRLLMKASSRQLHVASSCPLQQPNNWSDYLRYYSSFFPTNFRALFL